MRSLREEAERFDRRAGRYDRWLLQRWFFRPVHRAIIRALHPGPGERFLEVGCGTGNLTLGVVRVTGWGVGVDPSTGMIESARGKPVAWPGHRALFVVGAAERLPFPDGRFDLAASSISMHHWVDVAAGMAELRRVLRPGGRLVVADVAPRGIGRAVAVATRLGRRGDHSAFRPQDVQRAVRDAGFGRVRVRRRGFLSRLVVFVSAEKPGG